MATVVTASLAQRSASALGQWALAGLADVGGITLVCWSAIGTLGRARCDGGELWRSLRRFGADSLPIVALTAAFCGLIMVLQGALFVRRFGVHDLVGWYTGFATFREVGPVLVGLMFSGRVGAANTSELATMRVTEQLDALRVLAIDPFEALVVPRVLAMMVAMGALVVLGDLVAVAAGSAGAYVLLGVDAGSFFASLSTHLGAGDVLLGVAKAVAMGFGIAVVSTHFGLAARGGATAVGKAVHGQVVACALAIFAADYLATVALG